MDGRSPSGLCVDSKAAFHEFQPFLHAAQTQSAAVHCLCKIKPASRIGDDEIEPAGCSGKVHIEFSRLTMPDGVVQAFLQNAKQAK